MLLQTLMQSFLLSIKLSRRMIAFVPFSYFLPLFQQHSNMHFLIDDGTIERNRKPGRLLFWFYPSTWYY